MNEALKTKRLTSELERLKGEFEETTDTAEETGNEMKDLNDIFSNFNMSTLAMIGGVGALVGALTGLIGSVKSFGEESIRTYAHFEQLQNGLSGLTGSAEKGKAMFEDLRKFSMETTFGVDTLAQASTTLMQTGTSAGVLKTRLKQLGDIAGGDTEKFLRLSEVYGKIQNMGKLDGSLKDSILLMGVPIEQQLKKMGVTGTATAEQVTQAFEQMTEAGGMFYNNMDSINNTIEGKEGFVTDTMKEVMASFAEASGIAEVYKAILDPLFNVIQGIVNWLQKINENPVYKAIFRGVIAGALVALVGIILGTLIPALATVITKLSIMVALKTALSGFVGIIGLIAGASVGVGVGIVSAMTETETATRSANAELNEMLNKMNEISNLKDAQKFSELATKKREEAEKKAEDIAKNEHKDEFERLDLGLEDVESVIKKQENTLSVADTNLANFVADIGISFEKFNEYLQEQSKMSKTEDNAKIELENVEKNKFTQMDSSEAVRKMMRGDSSDYDKLTEAQKEWEKTSNAIKTSATTSARYSREAQEKLFDEFTKGLDSNSKAEFRKLIESYNSSNNALANSIAKQRELNNKRDELLGIESNGRVLEARQQEELAKSLVDSQTQLDKAFRLINDINSKGGDDKLSQLLAQLKQLQDGKNLEELVRDSNGNLVNKGKKYGRKGEEEYTRKTDSAEAILLKMIADERKRIRDAKKVETPTYEWQKILAQVTGYDLEKVVKAQSGKKTLSDFDKKTEKKTKNANTFNDFLNKSEIDNVKEGYERILSIFKTLAESGEWETKDESWNEAVKIKNEWQEKYLSMQNSEYEKYVELLKNGTEEMQIQERMKAKLFTREQAIADIALERNKESANQIAKIQDEINLYKEVNESGYTGDKKQRFFEARKSGITADKFEEWDKASFTKADLEAKKTGDIAKQLNLALRKLSENTRDSGNSFIDGLGKITDGIAQAGLTFYSKVSQGSELNQFLSDLQTGGLQSALTNGLVSGFINSIDSYSEQQKAEAEARGEDTSDMVTLGDMLNIVLNPFTEIMSAVTPLFEMLEIVLKPMVALLKPIGDILAVLLAVFKPFVQMFMASTYALIPIIKAVAKVFQLLYKCIKPILDFFDFLFSWEDDLATLSSTTQNLTETEEERIQRLTQEYEKLLTAMQEQEEYYLKKKQEINSESYSESIGKITGVNDMILTPQGAFSTDPNDYIIATKNPASLNAQSESSNGLMKLNVKVENTVSNVAKVETRTEKNDEGNEQLIISILSRVANNLATGENGFDTAMDYRENRLGGRHLAM